MSRHGFNIKIFTNIFSISLAVKTVALLFLGTLGSINPFSTNVPLLYPLKTSETVDFLMLSGSIEAKHWLEMG